MLFKWFVKSRSKIFDACFICAKNCLADGRYDVAKILLEKAIKYKKNDLKAYFLLAEILEKMDKKQEALNIYREVIILSKWKTRDENFQKASKKIVNLTDPSFYPMD